MLVSQIGCYALYITVYLALSSVKLHSIITSLERHENVAALRRKLWSVGLRAVAHVATVFVAMLVFLVYPDSFRVYLQKRLFMLVRCSLMTRTALASAMPV